MISVWKVAASPSSQLTSFILMRLSGWVDVGCATVMEWIVDLSILEEFLWQAVR